MRHIYVQHHFDVSNLRERSLSLQNIECPPVAHSVEVYMSFTEYTACRARVCMCSLPSSSVCQIERHSVHDYTLSKDSFLRFGWHCKTPSYLRRSFHSVTVRPLQQNGGRRRRHRKQDVNKQTASVGDYSKTFVKSCDVSCCIEMCNTNKQPLKNKFVNCEFSDKSQCVCYTNEFGKW